ncbi:MAG: NAD-dependent epimerase/dehydratase family protein, partial [Selenomonadaceae bacterium]|nr:NAD-dependent epimerase/dehydratase family protein [Selenomonadaceae bacterium]
MEKKILVTGAAGFIGANFILRLLKDDSFAKIIGVDNLNEYYDVRLKNFRLRQIEAAGAGRWKFYRGDLAEKNFVEKIFAEEEPTHVMNLAAQAGVRYSLENPAAYIQSNVVGFFNVLEACRATKNLEHLIYASSSSVYGGNKKIPFATDDRTDEPVSLYAATKKSDELMAHCYSRLFGVRATGLRFFTVYGAAGRPDMAYFKFTDKLLRGEQIEIYNFGNCARDFTYVEDIVEGLSRVVARPPKNFPPHKVYNLGNGRPVNLLEFVKILQEELIRAEVLPADYDFEAHKKFLPMQAGDVPITFADTSEFEQD